MEPALDLASPEVATGEKPAALLSDYSSLRLFLVDDGCKVI